MKKSKTKSIKNKKVIEPITVQPITISITQNGETKKIETDNILVSFQEMKAEPTQIKTMTKFEISYNGGKPFTRVLNVPRFRFFLGKNVFKELFARQFNRALGIPN